MAKTEKIYNMQQILDELKSSHGLPENLSTEAQLWDEIMKKEAFLMPEQLFPLIREIHGKVYPIDPRGSRQISALARLLGSLLAEIKPLATEYSVERSDTKEITSIRADIPLMVEDCDIYHFECEINNDSTMVIRMFEYLELEIEKYIRSLDEKQETIAKMEADIAKKDADITKKDADIAVLKKQLAELQKSQK